MSQEAYHRQTRVLNGEDQGIIPLDLRSVLEANGYEITFVAMPGDDALSCVEEVLPDVVLLNIKLAGTLDGIQTRRESANATI